MPRSPEPPPPRAAGPLVTATQPPRGCVLYWRCCQALPFVYLGLAWLAQRFLFASVEATGLMPQARPQYRVLLLASIGLAVGAQMFLIALRRIYNHRLVSLPEGHPELRRVHWQRTMTLAACSDAVAAVGLVLFLLQADWDTLFLFGLGSYALYAQAHPLRFLPFGVADHRGE